MSLASDRGMQEAYNRDSRDERRMRDLALVVEDFLLDAPWGLKPSTRLGLSSAASELRASAAHIVAVWD